MYDGLKLFFKNSKVYSWLRRNTLGLRESFDITTGEHIESKIVIGESFHLTLIPSNVVIINGSLHKFYHKNNEGTFTLNEIRSATHRLQAEHHVPADSKIERLEIGVNIPVVNAASIVSAAAYFSRSSSILSHNSIYSAYREWQFSQYTVKLYAKRHDVVRFEIRIFSSHKMLKSFRTLNDLTRRQNGIEAIRFLYSILDKIIFVPDAKSIKLSCISRSTWNACRNPESWKLFSKNVVHDYRAKIRQELDSNPRLPDYHAILQDGMISQAAVILACNRDKVATLLGCRLTKESVAEDEVRGNRPKEKIIQSDGTIYIYTICIHSVTRRHHLPMHQRRHVGSHDRRVTGCHRKRAPPYSPQNECIIDSIHRICSGARKAIFSVYKAVYLSKYINTLIKTFNI